MEDNVKFALLACKHALQNGYEPFAPHLVYPYCLDDDNAHERMLGMNAGTEWIRVCEEVWQCGDAVSEGMQQELDIARTLCVPIIHYSYVDNIFERIGS